MGAHRRQFLHATLCDLRAQLVARGSDLLEITGTPTRLLPALMRATGAQALYCETIAAPEEQATLSSLRADGIVVHSIWQSSLLAPESLPFAVAQLPDMFTRFRQVVERAGVVPHAPLPAPAQLPPRPDLAGWVAPADGLSAVPASPAAEHDTRSSFPYDTAAFAAGERPAQAHLVRYFDQRLAHTYKHTRNGLTGTAYSSKFSPWLATGALSARSAFAALCQFEDQHGANDSTYWLWFELLWRDYFRFLHLQYGRRLYHARGLSEEPTPTHDERRFERWCQARTGNRLVDAGMRELATTGYLSNRLRQVVASFLIHEQACDWRAGAAWFETNLLDYDVYSNQGNWLALAGRGTDPRGGRHFNPHKQAQDYDPLGQFQTLWSA